jgi:mevalonate kinase
MNNVTVSAPGKLMLLGEHAVMHGSPCLVTAVDQRMRMNVELTSKPEFQLEAPDVKIRSYKKPMNELGKGNIPKGARFVEKAAVNLLSLQGMDNRGIRVTTKSEFSSEFGFGSSSAVTVCVIKAISELLDLKLSDKEIFDISYKSVLDIQGKGSGFDVAAAVYGGTLYFKSGGKVIDPLSISSLPLIVGYSGIKADTVGLIDKVKKSFEDREDRLDDIYNEIGNLVDQAKGTLVELDWESFGNLMSKNQKLLNELGVSTDELDDMINASIKSGAYGAKVSGAGGGDCMIAIVGREKRQKVIDSIHNVGGGVIDVKTGAEGVRIEK